jgi:hypothetical protein
VTCCDCSAAGTAAAMPAAHPLPGPVPPRPAGPDAATDMLAAPPAEPDCVGPITIPRDLTQSLRALSAAADVDDFAPLWICTAELVRRLSRGRRPLCAQLIREPREAVASPAEGLADQRVSFLAALWKAARRPQAPAGAARQVDVTILVSKDGDRLYIEQRTNVADSLALWKWAHSFLQLLSALAGMPEVPVGAHVLEEAAEGPPDHGPRAARSMAAAS